MRDLVEDMRVVVYVKTQLGRRLQECYTRLSLHMTEDQRTGTNEEKKYWSEHSLGLL